MKRLRSYHIGFVKDGKTLVIQARKTKDELSPETWKYQGRHEITKAELIRNKYLLLDATNNLYHKGFKRVQVE